MHCTDGLSSAGKVAHMFITYVKYSDTKVCVVMVV